MVEFRAAEEFNTIPTCGGSGDTRDNAAIFGLQTDATWAVANILKGSGEHILQYAAHHVIVLPSSVPSSNNCSIAADRYIAATDAEAQCLLPVDEFTEDGRNFR
eukprot:30855-Eustigmatos_ZCMA.PRE.1